MSRVGKVKSIGDVEALNAYINTPLEPNKATMFHYIDGDNFLQIKKADGTINTLNLS